MDRIASFFNSILPADRSRLTTTIAGTTTAILFAWTIYDQHQWRSFDTGGSPPTWFGYARVSLLRFVRLFAGGSLKDHHPLSHTGPKHLRDSIPPRQGVRPSSRKWTLPQRLEPFPEIPADVHARIFSWTSKFARENPDFLECKLSIAEGHSSPAIFAKPGLSTRNPDASDRFLGDEIFHAHPEEGSLHIWLSEADCKDMVSRRWGERFPLAAMGIMHPGFGFVYTPRTMQECDVVEEIIRAGIEYVTGRKPRD